MARLGRTAGKNPRGLTRELFGSAISPLAEPRVSTDGSIEIVLYFAREGPVANQTPLKARRQVRRDLAHAEAADGSAKECASETC